jgi:hypothetical protein
MPSLSELRAELKELRKSHLGERPVSRMTKKDISEQIQGLRRMREETPAPAAIPSAPAEKTRSKPAVESVKEAKRSEFPVAPVRHSAPKASHSKSVAVSAKKSSKMERLMQMLEESSDEE